MEQYVKESQERLSHAFQTTISEPITYSMLKNDEERIRCALQWMKKKNYNFDSIEIYKKNNTEAESYITHGNNYFGIKELNNAHTAYSRAIFSAEIHSNVIARAYANRSAVLYEKHFCRESLLDIDRALAIGYPDQLKAKLYLRQVKCLLSLDQKKTPQMAQAIAETQHWIKKMDEKNQEIFTMTLNNLLESSDPPRICGHVMDHKITPSVPVSGQILQASNAIQLKYSHNKYGRHFVAAKDIECGEVLLVEKAFATVPARGLPLDHVPTKFITYHCLHCYKHIVAGIPCNQCVCMTYCSEKCRDDAWNDYHHVECPVISAMLGLHLTEPIFLSLKMTIKAINEAGSVEALQEKLRLIDSVKDPIAKFFQNDVLDNSKYTSVYPLLTEPPEDPVPWPLVLESAQTLIFLARYSKILQNVRNIEDFLADNSAIFLGTLILMNEKITLRYVQSHDFMSEYTLAPKTRSYSIMPLMSLFNHSCDANVCIHSYCNKKALFALEKIRKGEQIFVSYRNIHFERHSKNYREKILQECYNFQCFCRACTNNWSAENLPSFKNLPIPQTVKDDLSKVMIKVENYVNEFNLIITTASMHASIIIKSFIDLMYLLNIHLKSPCKEIILVKQLLTRVYMNLSL